MPRTRLKKRMNNLKAYNAWKRSTLDRITNKYRLELMRVYSSETNRLLPKLDKAFRDGDRRVSLPNSDIEKDIYSVLYRHMQATIYAGVSDGYREVTPEKKLSTWEQYPYWYPVEQTFTNLTEKKSRDSIFNRIEERLRRKNKLFLTRTAKQEKKRYLKSLEETFKRFADDLYKNEHTKSDIDFKKEILKNWYHKTDAQVETIFRTETTKYFNDSRVEYFQTSTSVDFVQIIAITDGRISKICECRNHYVIPVDRANEKEFKPPFHPNCRSVLSPLFSYIKKYQEEIEKNLGSEFGSVHSDESGKTFKGRRKVPEVPIAWG